MGGRGLVRPRKDRVRNKKGEPAKKNFLFGSGTVSKSAKAQDTCNHPESSRRGESFSGRGALT